MLLHFQIFFVFFLFLDHFLLSPLELFFFGFDFGQSLFFLFHFFFLDEQCLCFISIHVSLVEFFNFGSCIGCFFFVATNSFGLLLFFECYGLLDFLFGLLLFDLESEGNFVLASSFFFYEFFQFLTFFNFLVYTGVFPFLRDLYTTLLHLVVRSSLLL